MDGLAAELLSSPSYFRRLLSLQEYADLELLTSNVEVGDVVRISGIVKRPELNRCIGVARRLSVDKTRWVVHVASHGEVALKPDNLQRLAPASSPADGDPVVVLDAGQIYPSSSSLAGVLDVERRGWVNGFDDVVHGDEGVLLGSTSSPEDAYAIRLLRNGGVICIRKSGATKKEVDFFAGSCLWECTDEGSDTLRVVGLSRPPAECEAMYCAVVEIACRGSKNIQNWQTNFQADLIPTPCGARRGRVHAGFAKAYGSLQSVIAMKIQESLIGYNLRKPVLCTVVGHSLGGALATLAAYDLATAPTQSCAFNVRCVTLGSPRVGDAEFASNYLSAVPSTARIVHASDVVPRVPVNPQDPNHDGAVLGSFVSNWLHRQHEVVGAHEYVHVCKGTKVGGNTLDHTLDALGGMFDNGLTAGLRDFFQPHYLLAYIENLSILMDGGTNAADQPRDIEATVQRARKVVGGLIGLSQVFRNR
jgi:pimeloyl-ACP methyl ester carboxylesterase